MGAAFFCVGTAAGAQDAGSPAPPAASAGDVLAGSAPVDLVRPAGSPLAIDFANDPVLALARQTADLDAFKSVLGSALAESPADREAAAAERAARARVSEARSLYFPTVDVGGSSFLTLDRQFSNDPFNIVERSRPRRRTDLTVQAQVPFYSFGAFEASYAAAEARLRAAGLARDDRANNVAVDAVLAWSQVSAYQSLVRLIEGYVAAQDGLETAIRDRVAKGVAAESDLIQVASLKAEGEVQLALARRRLAAAESQFEERIGFAPAPRLKRLPLIEQGRISKDFAVLAAEESPAVRSAEAFAEARRYEARAVKAREYPQISTGVDYGRYGVLEGKEDYDLRASVNLRYRLFGGGARARSRAAAAEADAAIANADSTREEAARQAAIAWSDVVALEEQLVALESAYKAARQSRDAIVARFGALRGTLFDVTDAQNVYLRAATAYIQALTELDAARYVLLARTDRLLDVVGVAAVEDRR